MSTFEIQRVAACVLLLCACSDGVIPLELKRLGSLQSDVYTARYLYPEHGVELEVVWPRLGSPALLLPQDDRLDVVFYAAPSLDPTAVRVTVRQTDDPSTSFELPAQSLPFCDPDGLCTVEVTVPAAVSPEVLELCVEASDRTSCRAGALQRFAAAPDPLRLAVIADLHLTEGSGLDREARRFERVLRSVEAAEPPLHVAAILGDLGQRGRRAEQLRFVEVARQAKLPLVVIPGNHDFKDGHIVHYLLHVNPNLDHVTRLGSYVLIALNTGPGLRDEEGRGNNAQSTGLESAQLAWLDVLTTPADQLEIVLLHNPPWSVAWAVFDNHRRYFLDLCFQNDVRIILAGHTHRNEVYDRAGVAQGLSVRCQDHVDEGRLPVTVISARSTEPRLGGYRRVTLRPDGGVSYCWVPVAVD